MSVKEVLEQRGAIYGDYQSGCHLRGYIMTMLRAEYEVNHNGTAMPDIHQQHLWDIINKIIRLAVTPNHIDSWVDIQGYANLTEQVLRKELDE